MESSSERYASRSRHKMVALSVVTFAVMMVAAQAQSTLAASSTTSFKIVKLVGSKGSGGKKKDARMVNAWGAAFIAAAATPFWINDEGTGDSELIDGKGKIFKSLPFVTVPGASGGTGKPTGIVGNATGLFPIPGGTSADFIFATEDGTIAGWNSGATATTIVNNSATASYTGLALAANMLYAANHKAPGSIDVFDSNFNPISTAGGFSDPSLPAGFTPYNITALGDDLFVAYSEGTQAVGQVDEFDSEGNLIMSFTDPSLDEPWGLTLAPSQFGTFSNDLLVGNLGDGTISVFNPANGEFLGQLEAKKSKPLVISGLWALVDGTGAMNATANAVYFTAGPAGYTEGVFGTIQAGSASKKKTSTPNPGPYTLMPGMM
ncbi:MAG: TIGR03118 family protein [Candidatus Binatus sp.]